MSNPFSKSATKIDDKKVDIDSEQTEVDVYKAIVEELYKWSPLGVVDPRKDFRDNIIENLPGIAIDTNESGKPAPENSEKIPKVGRPRPEATLAQDHPLLPVDEKIKELSGSIQLKALSFSPDAKLQVEQWPQLKRDSLQQQLTDQRHRRENKQ
jgi:hypothetical protein